MSNSEDNKFVQKLRKIRETGHDPSNKNDYHLVNTYDVQKIESSYVLLYKKIWKDYFTFTRILRCNFYYYAII